MSWGWKLVAVLLKNSAIAKKMGEGNFEVKGHYGWMKGQHVVITCYFYPLALILQNYSINYRMCYLKIRCCYYKFFSIVLPSIHVLSFPLLKQLASLQLAKLLIMSLVC